MNPKYDVDPSDMDDDFEATHRDLEVYVRGGETINAAHERLRWERKVMRRLKAAEKKMDDLLANQFDTGEIAMIAQREIGPARKFVEGIIHWRRRITNYAIGAAITGAVTWFLAKHGVKP